jgi:hypothetical protein
LSLGGSGYEGLLQVIRNANTISDHQDKTPDNEIDIHHTNERLGLSVA